MSERKFRGAGVALVTPFNEDLSIDFDALANLIEFNINEGIDYIVALGTTAETPTLSKDEKEELTEFIREKTAHRIPLVIGIGGNDTFAVAKEIQSRDLRGYDAILSVTPYYNKPSQQGIFRHYEYLSKVSPLPLILYNVPGRTGVNLSARTSLRLSELKGKIIGIKEASGNLEQCLEIQTEAPKDFLLISGDDSTTSRLMNIGASGVISVLANAMPKAVKKLVDICKAQEFEKAFQLQEKMNPLIGHLFEDGNPAGVKALLANMGLIKNVLRLPLIPTSQELGEKILKDFRKLQSELNLILK